MPTTPDKPKQQWVVTKQTAVEADSPEEAITNIKDGIGMTLNVIPRSGGFTQQPPPPPLGITEASGTTAATKKLEQKRSDDKKAGKK